MTRKRNRPPTGPIPHPALEGEGPIIQAGTRTDNTFIEKWQPREPEKRPEGKRQVKRDYTTGVLIARYEDRQAYEFWRLGEKFARPQNRISIAYAERAGFDMADETALLVAQMKQREAAKEEQHGQA